MAVVSTHVLNGATGTHEPGVRLVLKSLVDDAILFDSQTDLSGRLVQQIDISGADPHTEYELCFYTAPLWDHVATTITAKAIAFRFVMPVATARYHIPLIASPNSYACWLSRPED